MLFVVITTASACIEVLFLQTSMAHVKYLLFLYVCKTDPLFFLCRWEHLIYQLGGHQELIRYVVIKGNVVFDNDRTMDL